MTGGRAFVRDPEEGFPSAVNPETVIWQRVATPYWKEVLKVLVAEHARETQSRFAAMLIADGDEELPRFWQIVPQERLSRLAEPLFLPEQRRPGRQ